jgi:tetratricopeptide (TPR) repeat protein
MQVGNVKAIRGQDIMAFDIIRSNRWERPIYFAVTSTPDSKIGLDRYFRMDGLAMKLIPYPAPSDEGLIDPKILSANLLNEPEEPNKAFQRGYRFRGLQDPKVHYDENVIRLAMNYRNAFMRLALYYLNTARDNANAVAVLDSMNAKFPGSVLPLDHRVEFDITNFYYFAGAKERYAEISKGLEARLLEIASKPVAEQFTSQYHPYYMLFTLYQNREEYDKALQILERINTAYSGTQGIPEWVNMQKAQMQAQLAPSGMMKKDSIVKK